MPLSRIQLAAALLEYDNDDGVEFNASPKPRVNHRDSAIFQGLRNSRLQKQQNQRPELGDIGLGRGDGPSSSTAGQGHAQSRARPVSSVHGYGGEYVEESRAATAGLTEGSSPNSGSQMEPSPSLEEVDLSTWGIPRHLLSPDLSQPGGPGSRPFPSRPEPLSIPLPMPQRQMSARSVSEAITTPVYERAQSVHVELISDGVAIPVAHEYATIRERDGVRPAHRHRASLDAENAIRHAGGTRRPSFYEVKNEDDGEPEGGDSAQSGLPRPGLVSRPNTVIGALTLNDEIPRGRRMSNPIMVPLPSSPDTTHRRSLSIGTTLDDVQERLWDEDGQVDLGNRRGRASRTSARSDFENTEDTANPFALPAPPMELGSRFDPKVMEMQRASSRGSMYDMVEASSRTGSRPGSRFSGRLSSDLDQATRPTMVRDFRRSVTEPTMLAMGDDPDSEFELVSPPTHPSQHFDDIPNAEEYGRPLRPSKYAPRPYVDRLALLRPRTLVMPSLLAGTEPRPKSVHVPEGFTLGEKPLPAGARASIINMGYGLPLSLSQKTFRSSLMVDGVREDREYFPGHAEEEGEEVVGQGAGDEDEEERKPGRLYGSSLIDQLEARKQAMRSKQRVFTGDNRPSMMMRSSETHATLVDMATLDQPGQPSTSPTRPGLQDRRSLTVPNGVDVGEPTSPRVPPPNSPGLSGNIDRISKSRSVFGVDTIWEREMAKLKVMQEEDERDRMAQAEIDAEKERKRRAKGRFRQSFFGHSAYNLAQIDDLHHNKETDQVQIQDQGRIEFENEVSPVNRISDLPPTLQYSPDKRTHTVHEDQGRRAVSRAYTGWESSDDEGKGETTPRARKSRTKSRDKGKGRAVSAPVPSQTAYHDDEFDDDDDEDVPLSRLKPTISIINAASDSRDGHEKHSTRDSYGDDDSDSDVPLSKIKAKTTNTVSISPVSLALPDSDFGTGSLGLAIPGVTEEGGQDSMAGDKGEYIEGERVGSMNEKIPAPAITIPALDDDDDDEPLFARQARVRASSYNISNLGNASSQPGSTHNATEIEDDLPLGWKHVDAAVRQQHQQHQQQQQQQQQQTQQQAAEMAYWESQRAISMMGYNPAPFQSHVMPMSMSTYGMPMYGQGASPYLAPGPMGMGMGGSMGMSMGGGMGGMGVPMMSPEAAAMADMGVGPTRNIDNWRRGVPLVPAPTGSARTVSSVGQ